MHSNHNDIKVISRYYTDSNIPPQAQVHFLCELIDRCLETMVEGGRMMTGGFVDRKLGEGTNRR
ncbi:hypothetical protein BVRB_6g147710 [Beta vulgaris subsp. vulgaris]|nr:hypothetical protein BVRB_6g147710 [Beta vulgaris subsp. vulgaris]